MEQKTYDQVVASIDPLKAQRAVADAVIYLGGQLDWGSDEFAGVTECLTEGVRGSGLPPFGDQDDDTLKFWGLLNIEVGNDTDYEPDEPDEEPVSGATGPRVVFYTNEGFYDREAGLYVVARVTEDEAGYDRWTTHSRLEDAKATAAELNRANGIDDDTILTVVASSMRLGYRS